MPSVAEPSKQAIAQRRPDCQKRTDAKRRPNPQKQNGPPSDGPSTAEQMARTPSGDPNCQKQAIAQRRPDCQKRTDVDVH